MRALIICVIVVSACGILAPDDGVDFEWSLPPNAHATGAELEVVEIERATDAVTIRGKFTLWTSCYRLEFEHAVVSGDLELRLTQTRSQDGCPAAEVMAGYCQLERNSRQ